MDYKKYCLLKEQDPAGHLYLLTWLDCLERLDVLLLEARHLQQSIIHALRAPVLYLPLRNEEKYLWGEEFFKEVCKSGPDTKAAIFVEKHVPPYPDPKKLLTEEDLSASSDKAPTIMGDKNDVAGNIADDEKDLKTTLARLWHHGGWGRDQRRHYHSLCAIQLVKQQILVDKIHLCRQAIAAKLTEPRISPNKAGESYARPKFLILRSTIMARIRRYIERLRDHQHQFNQVLDAGLQDHPRPIIERRRELGIYMDFLADRSRDLQRDMHILLDYLEKIGRHKSNHDHALIIHRWAHSFTSSNYTFTNEVGNRQQIDYVNSHYWMPERPDLQPVLAHEVAHGILRRRFDDLSDNILANSEDPFTELVALLHHTYYEFGIQYSDSHRARHVVKEMAGDVLAASVKGYSYLFALFLEIIGVGLEVLLQGTAETDYDLGIIDSLSASMSGEDVGLWHRSWYYRLCLIVAWLKRTHQWGQSALDTLLLDGVDQVTKELHGFIDTITVPRYRCGQADQALLKRMIELVNDSPAASGVKAWRMKRSQDDTMEGGQPGPGEMPRSMRRLDWRMRDFLFRVHLHIKQQQDRPLSECKDYVAAKMKFKNVYGVSHQNGDPMGDHTKTFLGWPRSPLYRHLYDIPWQCSLTRAIDVFFLYATGKASIIDVVKQFHHDAALGRELFTVAMEFHLWETSSPYHRLVYTTGLIERFLSKYRISNGLFAALCHWTGYRYGRQPDNDQLQYLIDDLLLRNKRYNFDRTNKESYQNIAMIYDANLIGLACVSKKIHGDPAAHRRAERLAGYKLLLLRNILDENVIKNAQNKGHSNPSQEIDDRRLLTPLFRALDISNPQDTSNPGLKDKHKDMFYKTIIDSINTLDHAQNNFSFGVLRSFLIRRISIAGSHRTINNHSDSIPQSDLTQNHSDRVMSLADFIKKPKWSCSYSTNPNSSSPYLHQTLLGRYDILTLHETKPICRDDLSFFDHSDLRCSRDAEKADSEEQSAKIREHFPSFFTRPEMATAVRLTNDSWNLDLTNNDPMTGIVALCAVVLHRRALRLDFLYRVLTAIRMENSDGLIKHEDNEDIKYIDSYEFGMKLRENAYAFLTDGWADILFVFTGAPSVMRLKDIFDIQNTFYQDFMVERTELILTPQCVPFALSKEGFKSGFQVGFQARLKEERSLSPINEEFNKAAKNIINDDNFKKALGNAGVNIRRMPGRMDFDLELIFNNNCRRINDPNDQLDKKLEQLARLYSIECVDRISTHIKILQPKTKDHSESDTKELCDVPFIPYLP